MGQGWEAWECTELSGKQPALCPRGSGHVQSGADPARPKTKMEPRWVVASHRPTWLLSRFALLHVTGISREGFLGLFALLCRFLTVDSGRFVATLHRAGLSVPFFQPHLLTSCLLHFW